MTIQEKIACVLVQPEKALNIGAVARAMKNMGFSELRLVDPVPRKLDTAYRMATNSTDILDNAKTFKTLQEAIADTEISFAVTRRGDLGDGNVMTPRDLAAELSTRGDDGRAALVFGPEHRGLSNAEISRCQKVVSIPSSSACPSLNLSHAVMVLCHEINFAVFQRPEAPVRGSASLPEAADVEGFIEHAERTFLSIGFLKGQNPSRLNPMIRAMISRADVTDRELRILRGMLAQVDWALEESSGRDRSKT